MRKFIWLFVLLLGLQAAWGAEAFLYGARAKVLYVQGQVDCMRNGRRHPLLSSDRLREGDTIRTAPNGYCILQLDDGRKVSVGSDMQITLWVFFHSPDPGSWKASLKAMGQKISAPFLFFGHLEKQGVDFEDETPNTLACARG